MWWSFDQWVIVVGLMTAFLGATTPVTIELLRRFKARNEAPPPDEEVVEVDERFINHLLGQIKEQDEEIEDLKKALNRAYRERDTYRKERDAANLQLAVHGIPLPRTGDDNDNSLY